MGAFAGWLHHPAHAPSYYCTDCSDIHVAMATRESVDVNAVRLIVREGYIAEDQQFAQSAKHGPTKPPR